MKKINYLFFVLGLTTSVILSSCSDSFLEEKKNYDNVSSEVYDYASGVEGRLNFIYNQCLPDANSNISWKTCSTGHADDAGKSTEEYSGFSVFLNPESPLTTDGNGGTKVPDYYQNVANNVQASAWGRIRNINDFLAGVENGKLSRAEKDKYEGQAYFFRAWCYYNFVKWYGGVPIVKTVLEPTEESFTPRATTKECIDFICEDIDSAIVKLSASTMSGGWTGSNWGRVTSGTAAALRGRVLLLWCSPLFNRANDESRWAQAYSQMKIDLDIINSCGYHLYEGGNNINASNWASMFCQTSENPEAVFVTLYNDIVGDGLDIQKNNSWERGIRPKNTTGSGKEASAMIVDMFPMADGKVPSGFDNYILLPKSDSIYQDKYPFMYRDPRFYRTFAFPGVRWSFVGDASKAAKDNPKGGTDYELWNYVWYTDKDQVTNPEGTSYGADNLLGDKKGIYVRKRSDDKDVNSQLYAGDTLNIFQYSAAPYMEIRYAEVLLNMAEVACGAGYKDEAIEYLRQIRRRVGYTGDCGIPQLEQRGCMSAILYERLIELAYEGKRFDDLRRWMLFDGGVNKVDGAPDSWELTGWGGNTCEWLGIKPLNGQRRENMEFRTEGQGGKYQIGENKVGGDPLMKDPTVTRCAALDYRENISQQCADLRSWYNQYLVRKLKKGDSYNSLHEELYINFLPRYYFLGFASGPQSNNKGLPQMIGWQDYNNGNQLVTKDSPLHYDPLAE